MRNQNTPDYPIQKDKSLNCPQIERKEEGDIERGLGLKILKNWDDIFTYSSMTVGLRKETSNN